MNPEQTPGQPRSLFRVLSAPFKVQAVRWLLPVSSGLILAAAYPPFNMGQNAWFALVPLLFAVEQATPLEAFRRGYLAGLVFFGATVWWTIHVTLPGMVGLVAFLALYFGVAASGIAGLCRYARRGDKEDVVLANLALMFLGAAGWVTLEWIRGQVPLGGFGWNGLGVSQWQTASLIQFSSYTGVYGVSALLFIVNTAIYLTVRRFWRQIGKMNSFRRLSVEFYVAMTLVCLALMTGIREIRKLQSLPPTRTVRLALIQANIPQNLKFDPAEKTLILDRYRALTELAILKPVDLIIWPETATPGAVRFDQDSYDVATNFAGQANVPLLTGTIDLTRQDGRVDAFNAAVLVRPDGRCAEIYRKIHLVPFGEYVPLRKIFPFMKWLTPIPSSFERGSEYTVFEMPVRASERESVETSDATLQRSNAPTLVRFAAVICFEDTIPELYRHFVQRDVDFMVNVTNDAWFKDSPAAEMHLANAVFRAVETRRPLVRGTNNGMTCLVDEFGFVHSGMAPFVEGFRVTELPLRDNLPVTFYTRHGNVFVSACVLLTGLGVLLVWRKKKLIGLPAVPSQT